MVQYVAVFTNKTLFTKTEANKQTKKKQRKTKIKRREKKQKQKTGPDGLWPWFQSLYFRNMLSQSSLEHRNMSAVAWVWGQVWEVNE